MLNTSPLPLASRLATLAICLGLAACGGGSDTGGTGSGSSSGTGGSTSSGSSSGAPPGSSSSGSSSSSSSGSSSSTSSGSSSGAGSGLYVTQPVIASCAPGQLRDSERTAVLDKLNEVRARHGLPAVSYDASADGPAAEAAMYMVANKQLTHSPSASGLCYTANAASLAGSSNLDMLWTSGSTEGTPSSNAILDYLIDNNVSSLGHRRWVLYPFLNRTTYGRVDGRPSGTTNMYMASVLKVIGNTAANVSSMGNDFVAYPYGNYPRAEFGKSWFLSFSVVASKTSAGANGQSQVNLNAATVSVVAAGGSALGISEQSVDYSGYGLANNLQWKVSGLQDNTDYTVTIANVVVNGVTRQFQYNFRLQ